jgi:trehalose 6-phosphate phosphatase
LRVAFKQTPVDATLDAMEDLHPLFEPFVASPSTAGLFLDFDGTLSEIARLPGDARPLPGVAERLEALADGLGLVAIVSGRATRQLLEWLGPHIEIWGVHGAERTIDGAVALSERAAVYSDLMRVAKEEAADALARLDLDGVLLEDKGVMFGLHFRAATEQDRARDALDRIAADLAARHGLRRAGGRLAFELRPPVEFSKAAVVLDRSRELGLTAAAFVGDDRVDLPGFDALDALRDEGLHTARIAVDSPEAPPELLERADMVLPGPRAAAALLDRLSAAIA